jgi:cytochrome c oxidase subunit III
MSFENTLFTEPERAQLEHTALGRHRLAEQYATLEQQTESARLGMWVFLATEVMFFGVLFATLGTNRYLYGEAFERASERLNWQIGGLNTLVLLMSSFTIALAVREAKLGQRRATVWLLVATALLGLVFMALKTLEYYLDFRDDLVPGFKFDPEHWVIVENLSLDQVPHVELFLTFYWIMTGFHALHVIIGVTAVLLIARLCWTRDFTGAYHSPVEVLALYWHFVDLVWIFLLPMLYLLGTHPLGQP